MDDAMNENQGYVLLLSPCHNAASTVRPSEATMLYVRQAAGVLMISSGKPLAMKGANH